MTPKSTTDIILYTVMLFVGVWIIDWIFTTLFGGESTSLVAIAIGVIFVRFTQSYFGKKLNQNNHPDLHENEQFEYATPANLSSVGGKLFLTNQQLMFKAHKFNLQKKKHISIPYSDIVSINASGTLNRLLNKINITDKSGHTYRFIITSGERDKFITLLHAKAP
ncbi:PH domain-containing protein [Cardiobacteriaceae bacterium TAE3-ERU3]|nr:PH domain-containing protein [Cardiobacteriaceae bacterium TAE3-ERU3]